MKFKVGDRVRDKLSNHSGTITEIAKRVLANSRLIETHLITVLMDKNDWQSSTFSLVYNNEDHLELVESIKCDCGAMKANTTHSFWCSIQR